jgi:hypothetical protein
MYYRGHHRKGVQILLSKACYYNLSIYNNQMLFAISQLKKFDTVALSLNFFLQHFHFVYLFRAALIDI